MRNRSIGPVLAAALALVAVCGAGATYAAATSATETPEGALKALLNATRTKNRTVIKNAIDWPALAKTMGADKEKDPEKRKNLLTQLQIVFVEVFASMGKQASTFQVGDVTAKGGEAKGSFMEPDPKTKSLVTKTIFSLHKKGKDWLIYNIVGAPKH